VPKTREAAARICAKGRNLLAKYKARKGA
jgi:hypothetical protein